MFGFKFLVYLCRIEKLILEKFDILGYVRKFFEDWKYYVIRIASLSVLWFRSCSVFAKCLRISWAACSQCESLYLSSSFAFVAACIIAFASCAACPMKLLVWEAFSAIRACSSSTRRHAPSGCMRKLARCNVTSLEDSLATLSISRSTAGEGPRGAPCKTGFADEVEMEASS